MTGSAEAERDLRVRLDLGYDGSGFSGWARQPERRTVQGVLEAALGQVTGRSEPPRVTVAGRTDAGVHARGQVAHVDVPERAWAALGPDQARRLRGVLPADVRLLAAGPAPAGFDARFSALWRRYAYRICDDARGPDPLHRGEVLAHPSRLDVPAMDAAGGALLGEHDFAAFCRPRAGASTWRTLLELRCRRDDGGLVVVDVRADAFCHSMVRALVGALLAVGAGRRETGWPRTVLDRAVRDPAVPVVPAHGLVLEEVRYPPDGQLAQRARLTRRVRAG